MHSEAMINGWLLTLGTGQGWPATPAGKGPVRIMPISYQLLHKPHLSNCKLPSDSHSICPLSHKLHLKHHYCSYSYHGRFLTHGIYYSGTSVSLELSGGIGSLCLPIQAKICSRLQQMVFNAVLKQRRGFQVSSDHLLLRH